MLKAVTVAVCLGAAAYGGYWFFASSAAQKATNTAIANARAAGYQISYADLATRGFPSRIDQTARDLSVTSPDGRFGIDLPLVQVFALSYQPNKVIVTVPEDFALRAGASEIAVTHDDLRASVDVGLDLALPLQRAVLEGSALGFATEAGTLEAEGLLAALRPSPAAAPESHIYDIYAELRGITLPETLTARLGDAALPPAMEGLRVTATARFAEELSVKSPPVLQEITFADASLTWGGTGLGVSGTLAPDALGRATGSLEVTLRDWRQVLDLAVSAGALDADQSRMLSQGLQLLGGGAELTAPITFEGGQMRFGFLPLGPAPVLPFTAGN